MEGCHRERKSVLNFTAVGDAYREKHEPPGLIPGNVSHDGPVAIAGHGGSDGIDLCRSSKCRASRVVDSELDSPGGWVEASVIGTIGLSISQPPILCLHHC